MGFPNGKYMEQQMNHWIHLKWVSNGMPLCPQDFSISGQEYLAKMQTTSSLVLSFSLPNHGYVEKSVHLWFKPTVIGRTPCTYTSSLRNTSKHYQCRKPRFRSHMLKLRGQWQLLCSRTQFRKPKIHRKWPHCWICNKKLEKTETLHKMHLMLGKRNIPKGQHLNPLGLFGSLCIGKLKAQSHKRTADGGEK